MSVPYEFPFVQAEIGPRLRIVGDEQQTRENSFQAVNDACIKIRAQKDDNWGLLIKTGGANAYGYAADVWLYDLGNGTAQVVDVVGNSEGAPPPEGGPRGQPMPSWSEKDIRSISEWSEPMPAFVPDEGGGGESGGDNSELAARVAALEEVVETQGGEIDVLQESSAAQDSHIAALEQRIAALEASAGGPYHCHGPVDLPIVMESLTSLRARGDINVAVTPGEATPPPPPAADDGVSLKDLALVKWLRGRDDDGGAQP